MIPKELFAKVRRIEITTSRLVNDLFAGEYHSVFKGQGIEFDEVREYQVGDDIRSIDWNVTARTGRPHIKKFIEARELTVIILVDASVSCRFGSVNALKSQIAAEIASTLTLAATRNNDKVGLVIFTDKVEKFIAPRKGLHHVLRIIREVLYFEPKGRGTSLVSALEFLNKITHRKTIAFVISDFLDESSSTDDFKSALSITNKKHDVIAITLNDPKEKQLPDCGIIALEDAESGEIFYVDSSDKKFAARYEKTNDQRLLKRDQFFRSAGVDFINISTASPYADELVKFFLKRKRRR